MIVGRIIVSRFWTRIFSFGKARAITIFPFIFLNHRSCKKDKVLINHESIHMLQAIELLIILFYLWYFIEFLWRFYQHKDFDLAYRHISFEKEAYANEHDLQYLKKRKLWNFLKYQ